MSLGTSIFLSSLLLASAALYIATKDRWKWKRIVLWPLGGVILIAIALLVYLAIDPLIEKREQRPEVATSFWDIPLGSSKSDVKFLKGQPKGYLVRLAKTGERVLWDGAILHKVPVGVSTATDADVWTYSRKEGTDVEIYRITFKDDRVELIYCSASQRGFCDYGLRGVAIGDSTKTMTDKFGPPSNVATSADQLQRIYSFGKNQIFFLLEKNRVLGYGVFDSTIAPGRVIFDNHGSIVAK